MVSPTFSEFQFTYGLTRELEGPTPGIGLIVLPRFPTQNQEAELPADMVSMLQDGTTRLAPLFIQYKRSEKMIRSNAGQWTELEKLKIDLSDGYFRFRPYLGNNEQHNKLSIIGKQQPLVFYVAPKFISHDEYRRHAANEKLYENAAFIQCGKLPQIDHEDHYIIYTSKGNRGMMCSEPETFPVRSGVETAFLPGEIENRLSIFDTLREEFDELRANMIYGFDQDRGLTREYLDPNNYNAEDPTVWIKRQQKFFRDVINADLLFFTDNDG